MHSSAANTQDFESFYRQHRVDAVRWATALVGRRDVGEDLAQDALLRVRTVSTDWTTRPPTCGGGRERLPLLAPLGIP